MSNIDRNCGRRHAAQLLQDGAEVETLLEMAQHHPLHFRSGMLDVLNNREVVEFIQKKRDPAVPSEPRVRRPKPLAPGACAGTRKLGEGRYAVVHLLENGTEEVLSVHATRDAARWARAEALGVDKEKSPYRGLLLGAGGWFIRRRVLGQNFFAGYTRDYDKAVEWWREIDGEVQRLREFVKEHVDRRAEEANATA